MEGRILEGGRSSQKAEEGTKECSVDRRLEGIHAVGLRDSCLGHMASTEA